MLGFVAWLSFVLCMIGGGITTLSLACLAIWNRRPEMDPGTNPLNLLATESAFTDIGRRYRRATFYAIAFTFLAPMTIVVAVALLNTWL